jgi:L-threonylcarbamoyladenylate synthase
MSASAKAEMTDTLRWRSWSNFEREEEVRELARFVRGGGVVVFPTESSYALGADPASAAGVASVYRIKGRPAGKPLPVVASSIDDLEHLGVRVRFDGFSDLEAAWPGPLTMVVPCQSGLPAACGRSELAVRIPGHRRLRRLLTRAAVTLTATSANLAGEEPWLELGELSELVKDERVLAIDQGRLPGGPPSTLVRWEGDGVSVLRRGAIDVQSLREIAPRLHFNDGFSAGAVEIPVEEDA